MLLSTLNTVAASTAAMVLFSAVADSPTQERLTTLRGARVRVDAVDKRVFEGVQTDGLIDLAWINTTIMSTRDDLAASDAWDASFSQEWDAWTDAVHTVVGATGFNPNHSEEAIGRLRLTHDRLSGRLLLLSDFTRPAWVDRAMPFLPWSAAWITLVGVTTIVMAWSLEVLLSRPMRGLADAADRVGQGDLSQEIRLHRSVPEIERVARAIGGMRDRLVQTIANVEARNSEMETILSNLSDGVVLIDRDGRILELNRTAQRLLAPPERSRVVQGRLSTTDDNLPSEGAPLDRWLPELRATEREAEVELEVNRDHGVGRRWLEIAVRRVALGRVVVIRDVTQDRELETLKRDFLSVITHELKTPLTPIEGYARLLQLGKAGPLNDKQMEFVNVIHAQAGTLKTMVQNLLDATRIEGGTLPIHPQALELGGFVRQVGTTWRANTESRGIHFELDNRLPAGTTIQADPFRLEQVIGNLLSNAAKFTPTGGTIRIEAEQHDGEAMIRVVDSGRGIPAAAMTRIFEKFYQVERGDTRASGGAGLGLYIVRQLVEAMGGRVSVESESGKGSRFTVQFKMCIAGENA